MPWPRPICCQPAASHDLRTYFIALATNRYPTMNYNVINIASTSLNQKANPTLQDPASRSFPATMEEGNCFTHRIDQVHRNTVRDGDGEKQTRRGSAMPIDPLNLDPPLSPIVPGHVGLVDLIAQYGCPKTRFGTPERPPASHYLADGRFGPQSEIEPPAPQLPPAGNPGHHPVLLAPAGDFVAGNVAGQAGFCEYQVPSTES